MRVEYQYLPKGDDKPDNNTLGGKILVVPDGMPIPQKGDCVMLKVTDGNYRHFEIIARHFFTTDDKQTDYIILIVGDAPDTPAMNFRE